MDEIQPGLRRNWKQFALLVVINGFVGGMAGLERSILPQLAETEFNVTSKAAILSFIAAFGITKAFTNYFTGRRAERVGKRKLLVAGWLFAVPVPIIIIFAGTWTEIVLANVLLGISQGLTWSSTVMMKIDIAGERNRGLAMGLNEFAGYSSVGIAAFLTGYLASIYGVRPVPFYLGIIISLTGLLLSIMWVRETGGHVLKEARTSSRPLLRSVFWETSIRDRTLGSVTQAGLINNLNDGMIWGLLPIILLDLSFTNRDTGLITAVYPAVWGIGQLFTGKLADHVSKKKMLFAGMFVQGLVIIYLVRCTGFWEFTFAALLLGTGTALVYPTFLAVIADSIHPSQRSEGLGVFRLWRDLGYPVGAIISGVSADLFGVGSAVLLIGLLTVASSIFLLFRMPATPIARKAHSRS